MVHLKLNVSKDEQKMEEKQHYRSKNVCAKAKRKRVDGLRRTTQYSAHCDGSDRHWLIRAL